MRDEREAIEVQRVHVTRFSHPLPGRPNLSPLFFSPLVEFSG
jgi:hypothetical protein